MRLLRVPIVKGLAVVLLAAACSTSSSAYFEQAPAFSESAAAAPGTVVFAGIGTVTIHPGDTVTFLRVEGVGAEATGELIGPLRLTDAALAIARQLELSATDLVAYRDLTGAQFTGSDGALQILVRIGTPDHEVDIVAPVLVFTVNGGSEQREALRSAVRVCSSPDETSSCVTPSPPR